MEFLTVLVLTLAFSNSLGATTTTGLHDQPNHPFNHVVVIVMENQGIGDTINNPSAPRMHSRLTILQSPTLACQTTYPLSLDRTSHLGAKATATRIPHAVPETRRTLSTAWRTEDCHGRRTWKTIRLAAGPTAPPETAS